MKLGLATRPTRAVRPGVGRLAQTLHLSARTGAQKAPPHTSFLYSTMRIAPLDDAEVELSLLSPHAREESESSSETLVHDELDIDEESVKPVLKHRPATWKEKKGMILLTCLCASACCWASVVRADTRLLAASPQPGCTSESGTSLENAKSDPLSKVRPRNRLTTLPTTESANLLTTGDLLPLRVSLFPQAAMVSTRRRPILPFDRSPEIMAHASTTTIWHYNAHTIILRRSHGGQCTLSHQNARGQVSETNCRLLTICTP